MPVEERPLVANPTISVILPNYNHARYLPIALQAILDQTCPPTEVLIVDDCSTDESWDILNDYASRYPSIKLFRNPRNMGVVYNLNLMLTRVSGDYLYTAASDDRVLPQFFERSVEMLTKYPQAAFCSSECMEIDETGEERGVLEIPLVPDRPSYVSPEEVLDLLKRMLEESPSMHWFHGPTVFQRSSVRLALGLFDPQLHYFCDGFLYHLMALTHGCCFLPEALACWRNLATNYSVAGQFDPNRRLGVVQEAKNLMLLQYSSIFPKDYVHNWQKRHICETQTLLARRFLHTSKSIMADLSKPALCRGKFRRVSLRVWSLLLTCQALALMFAGSLTFRNGRYWRTRVIPSALSSIRQKLTRRLKGLCTFHQRASTGLKELVKGFREKAGPPRLVTMLTTTLAEGVAMIAVIVAHLVRPLVPIRFGVIDTADCARSTEELEAYMCARELNVDERRTIDVFSLTGPVPLKSLEEMWGRTLHIHGFAKYLSAMNFLVPEWHSNRVRTVRVTRSYLLLDHTHPHFCFTPDEEQQGRSELRHMGVPHGCSHFVCFAARPTRPEEDGTTGNGLAECLPAMEELARRGYFVIWMGGARRDDLPTGNQRILSYSRRIGSDFLDLYLPARCTFLVGWEGFSASMATVFRRPVVRLDWDPSTKGRLHSSADLFVPVRFTNENGKLKSLKEMMPMECGMISEGDSSLKPAEESAMGFQEFLSSSGIEIDGSYGALTGHSNVTSPSESPETLPAGTSQDGAANQASEIAISSAEIKAAVLEMDQRLKGEWKTSEHDELLQSKAKIAFSMLSHGTVNLGMRTGAEFLRKNPDFV
jgi:putative glycosyltransferase (TIGR04372 family)